MCEAPAAAVRLQTLSETCNLLRLVFQTQPRSAKSGHYRLIQRSRQVRDFRYIANTMRMQNIIALSALGLLAAVAGGCSQKPDVVVTITADRGTNVTTITTNGYTVMIGSTVVGTNLNTNAATATKPPP